MSKRFAGIGGWVLAASLAAATAAMAADAVAEWDSIKALPPPELKAVTIDPAKTGVMVMDFGLPNCSEAIRPRCVWAVPNVEKVLNAAPKA